VGKEKSGTGHPAASTQAFFKKDSPACTSSPSFWTIFHTMKALITGGAGFIGSHLAQALCAKGARVVILDDLSTGSLDNLAWKTAGDSIEVIQGDVSDASLLTKAVAGCDWVFHQAAVASVPATIDQPVSSNTINLDATLNLLVAARDAGVKRVLFASSAAVYGDGPEPVKHEGLPVLPLSPYGLQKYASERYAQLFHRLYGLPTVSLRYFNVFGPRQSFTSAYSGVIARFCTAMLRGETPTIFGDGQQSRDFIAIDNVVHANLLAAEAPEAQAAGRVFNCATGEAITLLDLVNEINRQTGQSLVPIHQPSRAGDIQHSRADISAIQSALGYEVRTTWQEGLARTLGFYRGQ
jgi:UDP-glucose 4-epimerase